MLIRSIPTVNPDRAPYAYWEDFLTESDFNFLLAPERWQQKQQASIGGHTAPNTNMDIRRTKIAWLHPNQDSSFVWDKLTNVVHQVNQRYFQFDLAGFFEPLQLTEYDASELGHYGWHVDDGRGWELQAPRKLSVTVLLSDPSEFEGGELQLKVADDTPITLEQKRGRAWIFPSYMLHQVTPVTKGVRKSAVVWVSGPEFR